MARNGNKRGAVPVPKMVATIGLGFLVGSSNAFSAGADDSTVQLSGAGNDNYFKLGGYVRTWASWNLKDHPETPQDDKGSLQMLRGSLSLNADAKTGPLLWKAIVRSDQEKLTNYEKHLQDQVRAGTPGGPGSDMIEEYRRTELREFYVDADVGERVHLRLGKQQVVWGETDFFHPTDLIQGYDFRWRSFLEPESDELRKPLIIANATIDFPEADGSMQLILRPGLDRKKDIGNNYQLSGGRWMAQPFKGVDFLSGITTYDREHPAGDYQDVTGGLRWTGISGSYSYAVSALNTFYPDAVLNPAANPYRKAPEGALGDWIYPRVTVIDASVSTEIPAIDAVVNAEVAYQRDRVFNTGSRLSTPGIGPVIKKDVITTTVRVDKQLKTMDLLGTNQASFFSVQLFDTYIKDFDSSDDIVLQIGYGAPAKKHDTILTAFITLNYMNSRLNPGLAVGQNLSTGDAFAIPSISYSYGDNWRFLAELDMFFPKNQKRSAAQVERSTYPLADLANNNQFMLRATYQF